MLDDHLKVHRKELEVAINRALTDSPEINDAIQQIRDKGYDVFLIIEATIGLHQRDENSPDRSASPNVRLELTTQDERFLRSLKISPE